MRYAVDQSPDSCLSFDMLRQFVTGAAHKLAWTFSISHCLDSDRPDCSLYKLYGAAYNGNGNSIQGWGCSPKSDSGTSNAQNRSTGLTNSHSFANSLQNLRCRQHCLSCSPKCPTIPGAKRFDLCSKLGTRIIHADSPFMVTRRSSSKLWYVGNSIDFKTTIPARAKRYF
jgi:hypothetical protein